MLAQAVLVSLSPNLASQTSEYKASQYQIPTTLLENLAEVG